MRSTNPTLRKAHEEKKEMRYEVVARIKCLSLTQSKYLEREHILSIPSHKRINVQIPEVLGEGALSEEFKQIVKDSIAAPLNVAVSEWIVSNVEEERKEDLIEPLEDNAVPQSDVY